MKIVTYAGSVIWNENHPALKKYGDDCLAFRRGSAAELIERVGDDRDVLVLTDNDPASFELYDTLTDVFRSRRIHLFVCLPFTYESSRRKREILSRLENLEMAKSLCLVKLDGFLTESDHGETLGSLQLRIRNEMIVLLEQAIAAMKGMDEFSQYLYNSENGRYEPADLTGIAEELTGRPAAENAETAKNAETAGPEANAPEAAVPEATAPETAVPEISRPETNMPETNRPKAEDTEKNVPEDISAAAEEAEPETSEKEKKEIQDKGTDTPAKKPHRSLFSFLRRKKD